MHLSGLSTAGVFHHRDPNVSSPLAKTTTEQPMANASRDEIENMALFCDFESGRLSTLHLPNIRSQTAGDARMFANSQFRVTH